MEGLARIFAGEFNRSTLSIQAPDSSGSSYVVTPTCARCHDIYISGALTELTGSGDMIRCRLADPTGVFDLVIGGVRSDIADSFQRLSVPSFLTVIGQAQLYRKNGQCKLSVSPDSVQVVDRTVRDIWVLRTADLTLDRIEYVADLLRGKMVDDKIRACIEHYKITQQSLQEYVSIVESALASVQIPSNLVEPTPTIDPRELIVGILKEKQGTSGIAIDEVIALTNLRGVPEETSRGVINNLIRDDEVYQPQKGIIKLL